MWSLHPTKKYTRDYKQLSPELKERVKHALTELAVKADPRNLGIHKYANWDCVYSYEIGDQYRVLYDLDKTNTEIVLIRVGTHKVYD
ncbi:MAG: type II toxin-antitoxin system RelE/ParE family toxin [Candidatus Nitrosopolaris sp.]